MSNYWDYDDTMCGYPHISESGAEITKKYAEIVKDIEDSIVDGVLYLNESTLEDEMHVVDVNGRLYAVFSVGELFDMFPELEVIWRKEEDRWEGGQDAWDVYYRTGEKEEVME